MGFVFSIVVGCQRYTTAIDRFENLEKPDVCRSRTRHGYVVERTDATYVYQKNRYDWTLTVNRFSRKLQVYLRWNALTYVYIFVYSKRNIHRKSFRLVLLVHVIHCARTSGCLLELRLIVDWRRRLGGSSPRANYFDKNKSDRYRKQ